MDEDRIKRIARAMCRAARIDPDAPAAEKPGREDATLAPDRANWPAWMLFRDKAELFVSQHASIATAL